MFTQLLVNGLVTGSVYAIAAVGIKTSLAKMLDVGGAAIGLIVAETVFLGVFVVAGLHFLS